MAIFDDKRELVRQAEYVSPVKAKGFNKFVMAMAGYDDRGRRIKERVNILPGMSSLNNAIAKSAAKGTDAREVIAAQTSTEAANDFNKLKFAGNIASTIFTGGASGLAKTVIGAGKNIVNPTPGVSPTGAPVSPSEGSPYMNTIVDSPTVGDRSGVRMNPDESESTHLMAREYYPEEGGWFTFPTLFQNQDGSWEEIQDRKAAYNRAKSNGELNSFGEDEAAAIEFADNGSWKSEPLPEIDVLGMSAPGGERMLDTDMIDSYNNTVRESKARIENKQLRQQKRDARNSAVQSSVKKDFNLGSLVGGGIMNSGISLATGAINSRKVGDAAYKDLLRKQRLDNLNYL